MNLDTRIVYELNGTPWVYNPHTRLWECGLIDCSDHVEALSYSDLTARYTVSDWDPAARAA